MVNLALVNLNLLLPVVALRALETVSPSGLLRLGSAAVRPTSLRVATELRRGLGHGSPRFDHTAASRH